MPTGVYRRKKKPTTAPKPNGKAPPPAISEYVVYVNYPNNAKEYAYLCKIPGIVQGDTVLANGTRVQVVRTASHDSRAFKYVYPVPDHDTFKRRQRKEVIMRRLREISQEIKEQDFFRDLAKRSPEARRLWAELKDLVMEA